MSDGGIFASLAGCRWRQRHALRRRHPGERDPDKGRFGKPDVLDHLLAVRREVRTSSGTNPSPWGFCGTWGYYKDATARFYVRARMLRADLSRWMTVDPLWPHENPCNYVQNIPNSQIDVAGHQANTIIDPPSMGGTLMPSPSDLDIIWCAVKNLLDPHGFWSTGVWSYGNCCGPTRKCGSSSKAYNCTDKACKAHDICVGSSVPSSSHWLRCNKRFCNDIRYCWNQHCVRSPWDIKQCAAIRDIAAAFCNSFGGGPPGQGSLWGGSGGGGSW